MKYILDFIATVIALIFWASIAILALMVYAIAATGLMLCYMIKYFYEGIEAWVKLKFLNRKH